MPLPAGYSINNDLEKPILVPQEDGAYAWITPQELLDANHGKKSEKDNELLKLKAMDQDIFGPTSDNHIRSREKY